MNKKEFIDVAIDWLRRNADCYTWYDEMEGESGMTDDFYPDFTKAMNLHFSLQEYCDRLNKHLPCNGQEDIDSLNAILSEMFNEIEGSELYWSRKIYIDGNFDDEKCRYIATHANCKFIPIDDVEEHIGVKVIYNNEQE